MTNSVIDMPSLSEGPIEFIDLDGNIYIVRATHLSYETAIRNGKLEITVIVDMEPLEDDEAMEDFPFLDGEVLEESLMIEGEVWEEDEC